jgi:carbamoyl-phosphate synthase small subunit
MNKKLDKFLEPLFIKTKKENETIFHLACRVGSIEGIKLKDRPAFSVQYHPEATPGQHDSRYLFDDFVSLMKSN